MSGRPPGRLRGRLCLVRVGGGGRRPGAGPPRWPYVAWLAAAPVLWVLLPVPVLATVILASPLSLKIVLSRQLRAEIHDRTFAA